ncbi:MAG: hypothetical protein QME21_08220 [Anaerolineales bacterium]|jgi:hypothetical protein|nr:hypothetical protein [Anaerolineales bacterium]
MKNNASFQVRTDVRAGQSDDLQYYPGQRGWWWMPGGYIARPGRPVKAFTGWWFGPAPVFYYPMGVAGAGALGAEQGGGSVDEGTLAPSAP